MLVNDEQIRRAWEGLLMAEIRAAYFGHLVERNNRFQRLGTWLSLVFSSGATVAAFISLAPNWSWVRIVMPVLIALISLWLLTRQYPKIAIESADLHLRWQRLANDYQRLWENVYDDSALQTLNGLDDRAAEVSKAGTSLPYDSKLMLAWEEHVLRARRLTVDT